MARNIERVNAVASAAIPVPAVASYLGFETFVGLSGHIFVVPRFPSKSGLIHKHIVKPSETYRDLVWFGLVGFSFDASLGPMRLLDSLGSRRGVIGGAVDFGRCVPLVASPVGSAVLLCTLPVCRVRVACA
jgi:hypothetical protein